jgi:hypothetical protein
MVCGVSLKRFANSVISRITFGTEYLPYAWIIRPYSIIASESWSSWLNSSAVNRRSFRRARLTWTITCPIHYPCSKPYKKACKPLKTHPGPGGRCCLVLTPHVP